MYPAEPSRTGGPAHVVSTGQAVRYFFDDCYSSPVPVTVERVTDASTRAVRSSSAASPYQQHCLYPGTRGSDSDTDTDSELTQG
eukprot:533315-Rhodomonas_salina.1